ncbi:MAG TPA: cation:proton antiporter [Longimicrobiales bacterium]|nr:cation:proton antiporter [Longimicrobiales bacterium]
MLLLRVVQGAAEAAGHGGDATRASQVITLVGAFVGLLVVAAAVQALSKRIKVPFSVGLVLTGALIGALAGRIDFLRPLAAVEVNPDVVLFVFLPTLIFQSAFHLDARALRENLAPTLTLAVPGLLLSTAVIGAIMHMAAPWVGVHLDWAEALLLGSILSATDPVAVIALFGQLGAPKRLTVLVEGESLFNDATAIVLSRIIIGVMAVGALTSGTLVAGSAQFLAVFFGGLVVGWALALLAGWAMGELGGDEFLEITLTTILAYLSFYVAEHWLHVSGVMAAVAAGVVMGGWGKAKITPSTVGYLEHFWDYVAGVANALIFLMVGLTVDLGSLMSALPVLFWVVVAMLVSRAVVVYTLVPLLGKLPGSDPIDFGYQTVMFWGGLRGGIALAISLSLPATVENKGLFITLAVGAVLFTLLVQGLTIEAVVKHFRLDVPPLSDRIARIEGLIAAKRRTLDEIPQLRAGGLFSPRIAEEMTARCGSALDGYRAKLDELRAREMDVKEERRLLHLRCFAEENTLYYEMFSNGHLGERSYRSLTHSIEMQTEGVRHEGRLPEFTLHPPTGERLQSALLRTLERVPGLGSQVEGLRSGRTARDYEVAWARFRGSLRVLDDLESLGRTDAVRSDVVHEARALYQYWHESARSRLDQTAELFPEFVGAAQERLADRLAIHAQKEAIEEKAHAGIIPHGVAEVMLDELAQELRALRASQAAKLAVDPRELLAKVPFFQGVPKREQATVVEKLRRHTAPAGDAIVEQGDRGSSLFLVARGVVRVSRLDGEGPRDLATLMAGDFFGEMALLHGGARTATCRAVTPCALYELRREDLETVLEACPAMREALVAADERRRAEQARPIL